MTKRVFLYGFLGLGLAVGLFLGYFWGLNDYSASTAVIQARPATSKPSEVQTTEDNSVSLTGKWEMVRGVQSENGELAIVSGRWEMIDKVDQLQDLAIVSGRWEMIRLTDGMVIIELSSSSNEYQVVLGGTSYTATLDTANNILTFNDGHTYYSGHFINTASQDKNPNTWLDIDELESTHLALSGAWYDTDGNYGPWMAYK